VLIQAQGVNKSETNLLERQSQRVLVPMRCRAYHGLPTKSCLEESKSFSESQTNTSYHWTIYFEERIVTGKPFTQKSFSLNNL